MKGQIVSLDLETSGLDPHRHEIIEVGMVAFLPDEGFPVQNQLTFSVPFREAYADPEALEINGWGRREFPPQWDHFYAAEVIHSWLNEAWILGKNPAFDLEFIRNWYSRRGIQCPRWHHRTIDLTALAMGAMQLATPPSGEYLRQFVPLPDDQVHTALGDAQWNYRCFRELMKPR